MTKKSKFYLLLFSIVLVFSCLLTCFAPTIQNYCVYASNVDVVGGYTNVLDDLSKDVYFDIDSYPVNKEDYSLQVIDVAETNTNDLFVYVYQPSADSKNIVATSIFMSTDAKGLNYKNYYLSLVNKQGVFYKYRVDNFFVGNEDIRHYEITSIYRKFDESIDDKLEDDNENIINEVNFKVAKHWSFNDNGVISCADIETIKIIDKYVGFCRYEDGYTGAGGMHFYAPGYDNHFVAFTTDKKIDKLMEADVYYQSQEHKHYNYAIMSDEDVYGEIKDEYAYLKHTDKVQVSIPNGWYYGHTYSWDRIQTVDDFIATENREWIYNGVLFNATTEVKLTDEGLQDLRDKQWVLRFAETEQGTYRIGDIDMVLPTDTRVTERTIVSNVSILRLAFETDGVFYNLGVIDNKQSGDGTPDNYTKHTLEMTDTFKILLAILLLIVLVIVLAPILPTIFSVLFAIIKILLKVVWWLITAPFKLISKVFNKQENTRKRN